MPDRGRVLRHGRVSWPVGFAGGLHPELTGRQNLRFLARLYGAEARALADFVGTVGGLEAALDAPVRSYSMGMRARLAFTASMAMPFDLYLVDEITAVGDVAFREMSAAMLSDRLSRAGAVVVSHSMRQLADLCDAGIVLEDGQITWHDCVLSAIDHHRDLMGVAA